MPDTQESCGNCRFFKFFQRRDVGECRIRSVEEFPARRFDEWCGEYQPGGLAKAEKPISEIINRIPRQDELHARLVRNLQERILIRNLLEISEQRSRLEVSNGSRHKPPRRRR